MYVLRLDWSGWGEAPVMCCCVVLTRGVWSWYSTNHRGPNSGRGPGFLPDCMFLSISIVSDIIREWFVVLRHYCPRQSCFLAFPLAGSILMGRPENFFSPALYPALCSPALVTRKRTSFLKKCEELLEWLRKCSPVKNSPAPWSYSASHSVSQLENQSISQPVSYS